MAYHIKITIRYCFLFVVIPLSGSTSFAQNVLPEAFELKIDTSIDSSFIYEYMGAKFVPPKGKTLLIMGQTVEDINEYKSVFPEEPNPAGWSAYWGIPEFSGITETHQTGSGDYQNHQMLVDSFPNSVIHSAMWMSGNWDIAKNTYKGEYDDVIKKYSIWAKEINRPIFLRIGYEFDGSHTAMEPEEYVKAYIYIVDMMRNEGVENIAFVWHSVAAPTYKNYPVSNWYPGDDYVDWVAISVFFSPYYGSELNEYAKTVVDIARDHKKPVMIAETNPVYGISEDDEELWDTWFANFFSMTYRKNIRAIAFISQDWRKLTISGLDDWGDSRLFNNAEVAKNWFLETSRPRYLKHSEDLFSKIDFNEE
ncbi:MAG: hypothetical protein BalsKO_06640 [Balneolaceae bacterium]